MSQLGYVVTVSISVRQMLVPSGRTVSWMGLLKVLLLLISMLMVVKQK